ncbi:alpha/beta hydrolase [Methylobacterium durans]|uniref:alpha/beta hydrolase n=1 Tax=Methylobacterium durans TaxID=2202825 RepID=UPI002AFF2D49|nr:alpha/beta hydrolase [Methylobacterium durans]MEA1835161.1 alpha/beta hydrolase [Methylobacterium durans]
MAATDAVDWRGLDCASLTRAYDNSGAVRDSAALVAGWRARSAAFREDRAGRTLAYGPAQRQAVDLYRCGAAGAPCLAFVHGGYWQRNAREDFTCMAEGPLALGLDVALVGYTLAPEASLTRIAEEIGAALRLLRQETGAGRLVVAGWSAGGHLAALMSTLVADTVDAALAVSGIFDLEPIAGTALNDALRLTEAEVAELSPIRRLAPGGPPVSVIYGGAELPELRRQSEDYHAASRTLGLTGELRAVLGADHFRVLDALIARDGLVAREAARLAGL